MIIYGVFARPARAYWKYSLVLLAALTNNFVSGCASHSLRAYAGNWVICSSGKKMMTLDVHKHLGHIEGYLTFPEHFHEEPSGDFNCIYGKPLVRAVRNQENRGSLSFALGKRRRKSIFRSAFRTQIT